MISNVYLQTGLYDKALNYEFRLSKTLESIRDTLSNYAGAFNNIANIYRTKRDYKRAIYYYEISYKEYKDDTLSATCVYYGLGECYAVSDYNKSLGYLIRLENIAKIKNDTIGLSMAYSGMGTLFKINGEYKKAIVNFRKGLIFRENESFSDMYLNIGEIYFKLKNYDSSEYYFNKSLALAKIIESKKFIMLNYKNLYRLDSLKGDFKDAFLYQGLYQQYKDSIFNSEAEQKIVATEMNLTFEKEKFVMKAKQDEITKMAELNRKRQREIIFVVCVLLFLVVAVTITVYNGYVKQGKAYKLITHQKRLVDDKQKEILASIRYATRIQGSLLPTEKYVEKTLNRLNKI
jgi:tetratricopeptide (TPR) repeat protein